MIYVRVSQPEYADQELLEWGTKHRLSSPNADLAEWLPRRHLDERIRAGDVVESVAGRISKEITGQGQLFVVSTRPFLLGNTPPSSEWVNVTSDGTPNDCPSACDGHPVALVGQVRLRFTWSAIDSYSFVGACQHQGRRESTRCTHALRRRRWDCNCSAAALVRDGSRCRFV